MNKCTQLKKILFALRHEEVIAYPTESVFGLGCDPESEKAINYLLTLKKRSQKKGLILVAANYNQLQPYIDDSQLSKDNRSSIFRSWPGAITWVIPAKKDTPSWLVGCFNSIAVRVSDHPLVRQLCVAYGKPLVSTSANLSGHLPCRTEKDVKMQFGILFPVLPGKVGSYKNPSEIRDALTGKKLR